MKRLFSAFGNWWCRNFHGTPMAWINWQYECPKCGRVFRFELAAQLAPPKPARVDRVPAENPEVVG